MDIIKVNKVLWHLYRPLLKGTFNNKEVDKIVGEDGKRISLKEAAKARLAVVTAEASTQVEDYMIDEEEEELDKQYAAIEIDYKTKVISKE